MQTATIAEPVTAEDDRAEKLAECVELLKGAPQEELDVLIPLIEARLRVEDDADEPAERKRTPAMNGDMELALLPVSLRLNAARIAAASLVEAAEDDTASTHALAIQQSLDDAIGGLDHLLETAKKFVITTDADEDDDT